MASFKDTFSKGITTLNVKTSNFMEQNKIKTHISTLEKEIKNLQFQVGQQVYEQWAKGGVEITTLEASLQTIASMYQEIKAQEKALLEIEEEERQILGTAGPVQQASPAETPAQHTVPTEAPGQGGTIFCSQCGAKNATNHLFCISCGSSLK